MVQMKICFLLVSCVAAYDLKFDYQISEGSARFVENIETSLGKNTVKIHTPAHNDVLESHTMQDFQKGQQIKCLPSLHQCRLRDIDRKTAPDAGKVTESFVHSWEVVNTVSLGEDLRKFYKIYEYPLYKEKKIPSDATVLNITRSTGGRFKRNFIQLNNNCNGTDAIRIYGVDTGRSCNYLKICQTVVNIDGAFVFADCGNVHITSPVAYLCICCPWVADINPRGDDCKCTKMGS